MPFTAKPATGPSALADALRDSEQRFRAIVETSLQGKIVHRRFRPFFANPAAASLFGYATPEALIASGDILALLDDDSRQDPETAWRKLRDGHSIIGRRTLRRANGEPFRAEVFTRGLDWDGEVAAVMAVVDVSREERAMRDLRDAQILAESAARAKTRFLAGASHDMRTPLHGAMGRLQLLTNARLSVREGTLAREALEACTRLLHHIDDILDCAALESGSTPFINAPFDLPEALEDALATIEGEATAIGMGLRLEVEALSARRFIGDERRVRRIALGLLEEALRRRPDYEIVLEAHSDEKGFVLSVSAPGAHTGSALAMASDSVVDGMQMARALSTAMGGALIERAGQAGRWQCSAYLPLPVDESPQHNMGEPPRGLDVLVVEDTAGNRTVIKLVLEALGHTCHLAEDGARGVAAAASRSFDLVLMDLHMPGMDGLEAARRIRRLHTPWARMPIAALTASSAPGIADEIAEAGMDAFLQKPLDVRKLAEAIALLTQPAEPAGSIEAAELDQIEHENHGDKAENDGQGGHGRVLKLRRKNRP